MAYANAAFVWIKLVKSSSSLTWNSQKMFPNLFSRSPCHRTDLRLLRANSVPFFHEVAASCPSNSSALRSWQPVSLDLHSPVLEAGATMWVLASELKTRAAGTRAAECRARWTTTQGANHMRSSKFLVAFFPLSLILVAVWGFLCSSSFRQCIR